MRCQVAMARARQSTSARIRATWQRNVDRLVMGQVDADQISGETPWDLDWGGGGGGGGGGVLLSLPARPQNRHH